LVEFTFMKCAVRLLPPCLLAIAAVAQFEKKGGDPWETVGTKGDPAKRHEHAFVQIGDRMVALGGRRIQPVDLLEPETMTWTQGAKPPLELHHFQALNHDGKVVVAGAFTGKFPAETPVPEIHFYDPGSDQWSKGPTIPEGRRRGSAGAFLRDGNLYLVCGLTDGHRSGWVPWFDAYDFATGKWRKLPDAPRGRDHFQAVLIGDKLVLAGGRRSGEGGSVFAPVIKEVDVFDFRTNEWQTLANGIPTPRAGTMSLGLEDEVLVIGGESHRKEAHVEVEALNVHSGSWRSLPPLFHGRHASQPVLFGDHLYLQAGSVTRGGTETDSLIRIPKADIEP
jgi:hypothetical protein